MTTDSFCINTKPSGRIQRFCQIGDNIKDWIINPIDSDR